MEATVPITSTNSGDLPDMRKIAFDLASQGFKVFPLQPRGKLPLKGVSWKSLICSDEFAAHELWSQPAYRECNVGIHCEGLIVVDVDDYKAAADAGALAALDLPPTLTVATARGGRHLYFTGPNVQNRAGHLGAGLDVRSLGGYVVGPGSVTENGEYRVIDDRSMAEAPQTLIDRCRAAKETAQRDRVDWLEETPAPRLEDGRRYLDTAQIAVEGSRNETAYRVATELWDRGITAKDALLMLTEPEGWNDRCLPPLDLDELRTTVESAYRRAQNPFGCRAADTVFGQVVIPDTPSRQNAILSGLFSFAEFAGQKAPPFEWLVPDLIPADNVTLLYGDGGTGKSLLALQLAVATVAGREWIGHEVHRRGPVLFYSAEEARSHMQARAEQVCAAMDVAFEDLRGLCARSMVEEPEATFATFDRDTLKETPIWKDVVAAVRQLKPVLLVVDTLADVFAGDEIKRVQARSFIALLRKLAMTEAVTVLLLAHPSQAGMANSSGTSGSTAWSNSVRSRLYFRRDDTKLSGKADPDVRVLSVEKANYGQSGKTTTVRWVAGCFRRLADADAAIRHLEAEAAFLACLRSATARNINVTNKSGHGYAPEEFKHMPEAGGFTSADLRGAMERLEARGVIRKMPYRNRRSGRDQHRLEEVVEAGSEGRFDPAAAFVEREEPTAEHLAGLCYTVIFEEQQIAADRFSATIDALLRLDPSLDRFTKKELSVMLRSKLLKPVEVKGAWVRYKAESNGKAGAPQRLIVIGGPEG